jgi:hypothetical protein
VDDGVVFGELELEPEFELELELELEPHPAPTSATATARHEPIARVRFGGYTTCTPIRVVPPETTADTLD